MDHQLNEIFLKSGIEYASALKYEDCREINPGLIKKLGFIPRSVIMFLLPYFVSIPQNFSAYASSVDYHILLNKIGEEILLELKKLYPENQFAIFGDHSPIDERKAAATCGLGIIGDNGLLINEKYGSYVFIGEFISDLEGESLGEIKREEIKYCEHCGKCKNACPTAALSNCENACLSAITQKKGELSEEEVSLMLSQNTVWGCDACQRACPYNSAPAFTPVSSFYTDRIDALSSADIERMSDEEFASRAFSWRGRNTILRNLKYLGY